MTFPKMSRINPVDMSAPGSYLGLTFLLPIIVLVTLPGALGSHLICMHLFPTLKQITFSKTSQINPVDKSAHGSDLDLTFIPPILVLVNLPAALGSHLICMHLFPTLGQMTFLEMSQINPVDCLHPDLISVLPFYIQHLCW